MELSSKKLSEIFVNRGSKKKEQKPFVQETITVVAAILTNKCTKRSNNSLATISQDK